MVKHLYLFRHGQTNHNRDGMRYGGAETGELTELGLGQAHALGQYLKDTKIDIFYSSPYERAMHTAKIVASHHPDAGIIPDDRLVECGYWWDDDAETTDEQKEHRDINYKRIYGFFDELIMNSNFESVAVTSHGGVTRAILMASGHKIGVIENCEMFHLFHNDDGTWEIVDNKTF